MSDWQIKDYTEDRWIDVNSRKEGEDKLEDFEGELRLELIAPDGRAVDANFDNDGSPPETETVEPEVIDEQAAVEPVDEPVDFEAQQQQDIERGEIDLNDPESHLPGWMLTEITHGNGDSGIDLNKNGTQVVSGALGLEVHAECEVSAKESDFEYARYRAIVVKPDGRTFNAVGDCHIDESGKNKWDLERQAETRAKKRAVKWASSGGIEALETVGEQS